MNGIGSIVLVTPSANPGSFGWARVQLQDGTYGWLKVNVPTIAEMESEEADRVSPILLPASARLYLRRS